MFWLPVLVLILVAILLALWPLLRGRGPVDPMDQAVAFYQARKVELERQHAAGQIGDADFEAAMAEQGRHLLSLGRGRGQVSGDIGARQRRKIAALAMLVLVPGITLGVYLRIGQPGLPDLPLASRAVTPQNMDVASALQRIEQHLARNPDDGRGYEVVAPVYLRAGRFADAAFAYRRVIALLGPSATRHADLGEALVAEKDGIITAEARDAFEKAVALEPGYAKARFYLAVLLEQDGNRAGAVEKLTALAAELGTGPGRMRVEAEIARMRTETGGPASEAGQSIAALPEAERQAAIRSMVDQLDTRLAGGSGTLGEWQRLIRARLVLNEPDKAREALGRARAALAGEPDSLKVLDELAGEIPGKAP